MHEKKVRQGDCPCVCSMVLCCTYVVRDGVHGVQDDSFGGAETLREKEEGG
jgi:hypothetical protein